MSRLAVLVLTFAAALAAAGAASAGGIVLQTAPPPTGLAAGQAWNATITVKACTGEAIDGLAPYLTVKDAAGRTTVVTARHTARKGVWRARVVFQRAGVWSYTLRGDGGWGGQAQSVRIAARDSDSSPAPIAAASGGLVLLLGVGALRFRRRTQSR